MPEHECPKCDFIAATKQALQRHLDKKFPCDAGQYVCDGCGKHFTTRSSLCDHKRDTCKGRTFSKAQLLQQVIELTKSLKAIEINTEKAIVLYRQAEDSDEHDIHEDIIDSSQPSVLYVRPDLHLVTVGDSDVKHPQIYFIEAGTALQPLSPVQGIIVKFGETESPYTRFSTHDNDYEGGRLIDSIRCVNPRAVEKEFKKWMKCTKQLIKAKTARKDTIDTELFVVKSQEEYAAFVRKAKELAMEYEQENSSQENLTSQIRQMREDLANMMATIE